MKREEGFYWIKISNEWQVAKWEHYFDGCWMITGWEHEIDEKSIEKIIEQKLKEPE